MEFMDAGALTDVVLHTIMNENQVQNQSWICYQIYLFALLDPRWRQCAGRCCRA